MSAQMTLFEDPAAEPGIRGSAQFADVAGWRLRLRLDRWWSDAPRALVGMCNPSSAGAEANDPTVLNLVRLLRPLAEVGGFTVVNWEPYVATDPADLMAWRASAAGSAPDRYREVREANLGLIRSLSEAAPIRFVAWGNLVPHEPATEEVLDAMSLGSARDLWAFGLTGGGAPKHPMARGRSRIPDGAAPLVWRPAMRLA